MKIICLFFLFIMVTSTAKSSVITGKVTDDEENQPLPGANVRLEGTGYGAITDREGVFAIPRLPKGKYNLMITYVGLKVFRQKLELGENDSIHVDAVMSKAALQTGEVVVSASKRLQAVQEVPISIATIDNRMLLQRNITKLDEALYYVPGVSMNGDHVSIRGSSGFAFGTGSRVALLIDGFPILSGDNGDMKYDLMPLFDVDRVEVVKGAGSALYGTSALGGVINMVLKEPDEKPDYSFRAFTGIYTKPRFEQWEYSSTYHNSSGLGAGYSNRIGNLALSLSGSWFGDESYRLFDDSYRLNFFTRAKYFAGNTEIAITGIYADEDRSDWVYWHSLDSATYPPGTADYDNRFYSRKINLISELKQVFNDHHFLTLRLGGFFTHFENSLDFNNPDYRASDASSINTELQMNSRLLDFFQFTYGAVFIHNTIDSKTYGNNEQQIVSAYAQGEINPFENFIFTLGGRYDIEKTTSLKSFKEFSPKAGLSYKLPYEIQLRASVGRGFRAPTVAERFASVEFQGFSVVPNPDLKPEYGMSYEIGAGYTLEMEKTALSFDLALFRNDMFDLIEPSFISPSDPDIMFKNVTRARIDGMEFGIKSFLFGLLGIETSVTAMDPKDITLNETLKYRSRFLWYSRLYIPYKSLELQVDYRYISRIDNIDATLDLQVSDADARVEAHVVDARVIFDMTKAYDIPLSITLSAKNLLDYYYTEMVGNLAPTRLITLQADLKF